MDRDRTPYPGLRAFRHEESDLFFGREGHVDELVDRLGRTRFLAVLGASGSGKSSLVRTGLFDALELGLLAEAGSSWQIVDTHPGAAPIENLARALLLSAHHASEVDDGDVETLASFLRRGPLGIAEWCEDGHLQDGNNLLLLVDQFEELFRYDSYETRERAQAFVALLIESARQRRVPIYVVLTMRSEYLGACSLIDGLAEAINRGQYLTPRMTREQCRAAIEGPAGVCGFEIDPALVNRMLNDLASFAPWEESEAKRPEESEGSDSRETSGSVNQLDRLARRADQLPLMQHVLNRLWTKARATGGDGRIALRMADYDGLERSLAAHADEVLAELVRKHGEDIRGTVERVFRALVAGNSIAEAVRRPTPFGELVELEGGDDQRVRTVVEAFRAPGCSFLMPPAERPLFVATRIDISHESLIRQWPQLSRWVESEGAAAASWRRLDEAARRHAKGEGSLLKGLDLSNILQAHAERPPTPAWSQRYGSNYPAAMAFLAQSQKAEAEEAAERDQLRREAEREAEAAEQSRRRVRWFQRLAAATFAAAVISALMVAGSIYVLRTSEKEAEARLAQAAAALDAANRDSQQQREDAARQMARAAAQLEQANAQVSSAKSQMADAERQIVTLTVRKIAQWQSEGNWQIAGGFFAEMANRLPRNAAGEPQWPAALADQLRRPVQLQAIGEQALRASSDGRQADGRREAFDTEGPLANAVVTAFVDPSGGRVKVAIAGNRDKQIVLFVFEGSGRSGESWQRSPAIPVSSRTVGGTSDNAGRVRNMAFSDDGSQLAVMFADRVYVGTPSDFQAQRAAEVQPLLPGSPESHTIAQGEFSGPAAASQIRDTALNGISTCSGPTPTFLIADGTGNVNRIVVAAPSGQNGGGRPRLETGVLSVPDAVAADRQAWLATTPRPSFTRHSDQVLLVVGGRHILVAGCRDDTSLERIHTAAEDNIQFASFVSANRIAVASGGTVRYLARNPEQTWSLEQRAVQLPPGSQLLQMRSADQAWVTTARIVHEQWRLQPAGAEGPQSWVTVASPDGRPPEVQPVGELPLVLTASDSGVFLYRTQPSETGDPTKVAMRAGLRSWLPPGTADREYADTLRLLTAAGLIGPSVVQQAPSDKLACYDPVQFLVDTLEQLPVDAMRTATAAVQAALEEISTCPQAGTARREYLRGPLLQTLSGAMSMEDIRTRARQGNLVKSALVAAGHGDPIGMRLLALMIDSSGLTSELPIQALQTSLRYLAIGHGSPVPHTLVKVALDDPAGAIARQILGADPPSDGRLFEIRAHSERSPRDQLVALSTAERLYALAGDNAGARRVGEKRARRAAVLSDDDIDAVWREINSKPVASAVVAPPESAVRTAGDTYDAAALRTAIEALDKRLEKHPLASPLARGALLRAEGRLLAGAAPPHDKADYERMLDLLSGTSGDDAVGAGHVARWIGARLAAMDEPAVAARAYARALSLFDRGTPFPTRGTDWLNASAAILLDRERFLVDAKADDPELAALSWNFLQIFNWNSLPTDSGERKSMRLLLEGCVRLQERIIAASSPGGQRTPGQSAALIGLAYAQFWLGVLADRDSRWDDRSKHITASVAAIRRLAPGPDAPARHRLQYGRSFEWNAGSQAKSSYYTIGARIAAWGDARSTYLELLQDVERGRDDDYLVASVLARYSYVLTNMADDLVLRTVMAFETDQRTGGIAQAARALALRAEQLSLLKPGGGYTRLIANNEAARELSYLEPNRGPMLAYTVGVLVGFKTIDATPFGGATRCEYLGSHPYDPMRRVSGQQTLPSDPQQIHLSTIACKSALRSAPEDARLKFTLGRLMTADKANIDKPGADRDEMFRMLVDAGRSGYVAAWNNLALALPEACSLRGKLQRLHLSLTMRDHAETAADLLGTHGPKPVDAATVAWLREEAKLAREEAPALLNEIMPLDVAKVKKSCSLE